MSVIIRLQNLPISANAANIRRFFGGLAIPEGGVHIVGGVEGDAFIAFATDEDARKAMLLDRQSINGTLVRLFLSSKTEMQSIIESARNSVLLPSTALGPPQIPSLKPEAMNSVDLTPSTLPSSFPTYRNGGTVENSLPVISDQAYNKIAFPSNVPMRSVDPSNRDKGDSYPVDVDRFLSRNNELSERDATYYARQMPMKMDARDNCQDLFRSDIRAPKFEQSHDSYYNYDYGRRPPPQNEVFSPRVDRNSHNSPRDRFDYGSRSLIDGGPQDYRKYPHELANNRSDKYGTELSNRTSQQSHHPYSTRSINQDLALSNNKKDFERDFSVRPPWLSDDLSENGSKRPFQTQVGEQEDHSSRKRKPVPSRQLHDKHPNETEFVVRVVLPLSDVGVKVVFEIFRGVHIVPKWGIRLEEDKLQRFTGNVLIMLTGSDSYDRALTFNGRACKNGNINVYSSTRNEFYNVTDSNFSSKCPPEILKNIPSATQCTPPHYSDGCLELAELPSDVTDNDVVQFLGAPGLTAENVHLCRFFPNDKALPKSSNNLRALVTLPSANDLKILLSAQPRPFRPNMELPVRLTAISKVQLLTYSKQQPRSTNQNNNSNNNDSTKNPNTLLTCAYLHGLSFPMKEPEVIRLFPFILIPGDAIRMSPDGTAAYIDFISENNCRRVVSSINKDNSVAKQAHPLVNIEAITRGEMESRLIKSKATEDKAFDRFSKRDRDPRELRGQWDSRSRLPPPMHHPLSPFDRPVSGRLNFEDGFYERSMPPQMFEDFPIDQFDHGRRPRLRIDAPHSLPPPAMFPPEVGSLRSGMSDRIRHLNHNFVTVYIGNIPPSVTVEQLSGILRDYYFIPGTVRFRRNTQGQPVEALVDFKSSYEADRVLRGLNGFRISGRQLIVRFDHRI